MFNLIFFGAILISNLINANDNLSCYECNSCTSIPTKISTNNRLCFRIQMHCFSADIHVIDLKGDRLFSNYSSSNCGQTFSYSSTCTITYQCCYTNKCNTYESPLLSSSSFVIINKIVISLSILLTYYRFLS